MSHKNYKYLVKSPTDEGWGITVNTVGFEIINQGYLSYPPHSHPKDFYFTTSNGRRLDSYQLIYIAKGKGTLYIEDKTYKITEGDMMFIKPYEWHSYFPDKSTGWNEYWIGFEGEAIENILKSGLFNKKDCIYKIGIKERIIDLYEHALKIANEEKSGCQQYLSGIANMILGMTLYYKNNNSIQDLSSEQIDKSKIIIRTNILNDISLEDIAAEVNMSYSWFRKQFKKYTGLSPAHYIQELKIKQAKELVSSSSLSINEISYHLKFESPAYFIKVFKKHTGCTPLKYRSKFNSNKDIKEQ